MHVATTNTTTMHKLSVYVSLCICRCVRAKRLGVYVWEPRRVRRQLYSYLMRIINSKHCMSNTNSRDTRETYSRNCIQRDGCSLPLGAGALMTIAVAMAVMSTAKGSMEKWLATQGSSSRRSIPQRRRCCCCCCLKDQELAAEKSSTVVD